MKKLKQNFYCNNYTNNNNNKRFISLPYKNYINYKNVNNSLRDLGFNSVFSSKNKIINKLCKTANLFDIYNTCNIVYKFTCTCNKFYFGETGRKFIIRINEHLNVKLNNNQSIINKHIIQNNCLVDKSNFKIIKSFSNETYQKRKNFEGMLIKKHQNNLNMLNIHDKNNHYYDMWI